MECPKCGYEPTMAEHTSSPDICSSCGVVYAKVKASGMIADASDRSGGFAGAKAAVAASRKERTEQEANEGMRRTAPGFVSVTDINMPFWSMVQFMVKLALASIPAIIILMILLAGLTSFLSLLT